MLSKALPKAFMERGKWILKQQEIAESSHSKILKEQLLISNRVGVAGRVVVYDDQCRGV